ncbi:dolichyl-diphosphooligosaccharide--protein glycosyltransferase subunit 4-like [Glossina fuscipes]|uniref:Dolichyl-diphosphooligosaccharide--protein glycosyltransferase subunit 4-like n=1 Tax=Glossina fuscipes TaxID=7396 RepID=A0A9C6DPM5_9MUSC|nr:dolichyl-diphosphooligosaccharide--protein glycosyltransferase subunit 4-like [Glossina fuscipes]
MFTDAELEIFSDFLGGFLLLLVVLYHYVNAKCKTNSKTK